jgi:hypothetical protein
VENPLNLPRNRGVGFIEWLDGYLNSELTSGRVRA